MSQRHSHPLFTISLVLCALILPAKSPDARREDLGASSLDESIYF